MCKRNSDCKYTLSRPQKQIGDFPYRYWNNKTRITTTSSIWQRIYLISPISHSSWTKSKLCLNSIQQSENWEVCSYKSMNWWLNVLIEETQVSDRFYWIVYPSHSYVLYKPEEIRSVLISEDKEEIEKIKCGPETIQAKLWSRVTGSECGGHKIAIRTFW